MDVLPTRYALLSGSHSIWLEEMTLSFKENRKKQPKYVSNTNTYILESEKKKKWLLSGSIQVFGGDLLESESEIIFSTL